MSQTLAEVDGGVIDILAGDGDPQVEGVAAEAALEAMA
jgi:hypothetical protein